MGFNLTGIATNFPLESREEIEQNLGFSIEKLESENTSLEEASANHKQEDTLFVLSNSKGALVFPDFGGLIDQPPNKGEMIQFVISDVSDTYYFEKFKDGVRERKLVMGDGEVFESEGEGVISEEDETYDKAWEYIESFLGMTEKEIAKTPFKKYRMKPFNE